MEVNVIQMYIIFFQDSNML